MGKKKKRPANKASTPRSFTGVIRPRSRSVQQLAHALRSLIYDVLPDAEESYYGGQRPMAMYRTTADICWIQPLKDCCNLYFMRGTELTDPDQILQGSSDRFRFAKIRTEADLDCMPLQAWLQESVALNTATLGDGLDFEQVLDRVRKTALGLPDTKETVTWGKPHFRVGEKIFCGCGEVKGSPSIGLKMEANKSVAMMKLPGIIKAPYSRPGDGWVSIDPAVFADWDEVADLIEGSYRLIAPKRTVAQLDAKSSKAVRRRKSG